MSSNDDPFTLDLFNTTTSSPGLGFGGTAFGGDFGTAEADVEDTSSPACAAAASVAQPVQSRPGGGRVRQGGDNFYLAGERGLAKGWKSRARDNLEAIRLSAEIEARRYHRRG